MQSIALLLFMLLLVFMPHTAIALENEQQAGKPYEIELDRWKIYNDGTHPVETTTGINNALIWAAAQGITAATLPSGTYRIEKNGRINMVSNMKFELPDDAILQKETNGSEAYQILYIGYGVNHVHLKGGTYRGDKDTHDYSKKAHKYSAGTHEGGHGILIEGASDITIEGVKADHFTGDGLVLGGTGTMLTDLYDNGFVPGAIDKSGRSVTDSKRMRTQKALLIDKPVFQTERSFELSNMRKLPAAFTVFFYKEDGVFIRKVAAKQRDSIEIPNGAHQFHIVFDVAKAAAKGAYLEVWNRVVTRHVIVKGSEFAFNRRQGVTVGGADDVLLTENSFHDMKGVAPQSGVDVEGGYEINGFLNTDITIQNNDFYDNAAYDLILFDGRKAFVENNRFRSRGLIGLAVSNPFSEARIVNNHFDGSRIVAENDADFVGNFMNDSYAYFEGPNISVDGMDLTDSMLSVNSKVPFGVSVSNITLTNNKKIDNALTIWGKPVHIRNVVIRGETKLGSISSGASEGSIIDHLQVFDYNSSYPITLPPGTYNHCVFEGTGEGKYGAVNAVLPGKYVFNDCTFKSGSAASNNFYGDHEKLDLTIRNSTFEMSGNSRGINIQSAANVFLENNTVTALNLTSKETELIKLNDFWKRNVLFDIKNVVIRGNTITANVPAIGISTIYAGTKAPAYTIENNTLTNGKLLLKSNDKTRNNIMKSQLR